MLPTVNPVILGNGFFRKHDTVINQGKNLINIADLAIQISEIKTLIEPRRKVRTKRVPASTTKKNAIQPNTQMIIETKLKTTANSEK